MASFGLLRTNVGLTTNIKIMVDSNYNLSLDSIDSKPELSIDKLKKVSFNKKNYYDELIKYFFDGIPSDTAYYIKNDEDQEIMGSDFSSQYDEIYQYGARNITNNKNYKEEFEYFAPLYIQKGSLPKYFIIFRVDGPGVISLNKNNFATEILSKMKVVKIFDLTKKTILGEWLETNFSEKNNFFPNAPLEMDFRQLEFCRWNGINFESGGYVSNSLFVDDILDEEKEIFELEKFIFDKFRDLKVVVANILNFSFLFDDEPSTPEFKRKWSINRYLGFYVEDIELVHAVSPYIAPFLRNDVVITEGNILFSPSSEDPFLEGWSDSKVFYIEYLGQFYKVEKYTQSKGRNLVKNPKPRTNLLRNSSNNTPKYSVEEFLETYSTRYRIISDIDLKGKESLINKNFGYIDANSTLKNYDNTFISIPNFDEADIWIIEIDGIYHKLIKSRGGSLKIISDYSFNYGPNKYEYTIAGTTKVISTIVDANNPPKKWSIYRIKLSDIKDFDDRIIDTEFSKFEYEKKEDLTTTDESKMYLIDLNSGVIPPTFDDFKYQGKVVNIPTSSEYTANLETFKIEDNRLTELWKKNSLHCRWAFKNSLSSNDYPYLLNNSTIFEDFNRTTNTYERDPKRIERNLDYFYTINLATSSYTHHSLHVCSYTNSNSIDSTFRFELNKYLSVATYSSGSSSATYSYDYFSHIFDRKVVFDNGKVSKNSKKYSILNSGDNVIPNLTLFKGIKFFIYDVKSIKKSDTGDLDINLKNSNTFDNYKFSILLSDNDWSVNDSGQVVQSANGMNWTIIDEWKMDTTYPVGSIGVFDDILYISQIENEIRFPTTKVGSKDVKSAPHNNTIEWAFLNMTYSIFWSPLKTYNSASSNFYDKIVYNSGEYYLYENSGSEDFWNPNISSTIGYNTGDVVLFKNQYFMSMTSSNYQSPDNIEEVRVSNSWQRYWVATQSSDPNWNPIEIWNPSRKYRVSFGSYRYVVHNDILYASGVSLPAGQEPGISELWERLYSLEPDTSLAYQNTYLGNPIIRMNNKYYLINSNNTNSTLDNGIIIYINKKWKNILININIADNTLQNISNSERDILYNDINKKLTANNFILSINDIRNKFGFTDYVSYVVIDENGKINKYNYEHNIENLPYMIICETAEDLDIKVDSLRYIPVQLTGDLNARKSLSNGQINSFQELNYYNNLAVGARIEENKFQPKVLENYHGNRSFTENRIYRYSGEYTPLFYDIELFQKKYEVEKIGNYKFDTSLTFFGTMKERRISKVNRKGNILKLKNSKDNRSIYPMLDEFGYTTDDFFIFCSTWDLSYHVETSLNETIKKDIPTFVASDVKTSEVAIEEISFENGVTSNPLVLGEIGRPPIELGTDTETDIDENLSTL
jgi:hypothetical protein